LELLLFRRNFQVQKASILNSILFAKKEAWKVISIVLFRLMRRDDDDELEELNNQIEALR
jgi:hypothetical protein